MYVIKEVNSQNYVTSSTRGRIPLSSYLHEAATFKNEKNATKACKSVSKCSEVRLLTDNKQYPTVDFFTTFNHKVEALSALEATKYHYDKWFNHELYDIYQKQEVLGVQFEIVEVKLVEAGHV